MADSALYKDKYVQYLKNFSKKLSNRFFFLMIEYKIS